MASQASSRSLPSAKEETVDVLPVKMGRERKAGNKFCQVLFWGNILLIMVLAVVLTFHDTLPAYRRRKFDPKKWSLRISSSTACAGILGFLWQAFTGRYPSRTLRTTFWLSPLLTLAYGVLLIAVETPVGLAVAAVAMVSSVLQALYACWVSPRFEHAGKILAVSVAHRPPKLTAMVFIVLVATALYIFAVMIAIGGATATGTKLHDAFIFLIMVSFTWTMQIVRNMIQVIVSHIKHIHFASGGQPDFKVVLRASAKHSFWSICISSAIIPVLDVIRGFARGVSLISGDTDEFMFSCANCCAGVALRTIEYGNVWGFVHLGVYNKGIVQATCDTWEIFRRVGIEKLIDSDLTGVFCFFSGILGGSACALVAGIWALFMHKRYAAEATIYAFVTGYFTVRVAMAWIQASVTAYYVTYAENPRSQQFDNTIPDYMAKLQRLSRA